MEMTYKLALLAVLVSVAYGYSGVGLGLSIAKEVKIDSAFRYDDDLFLISNDEYMAVSPAGFEKYIRVRTGDGQVPVEETLQAAVTWPAKPTVAFFGKSKSFKTNQSALTAKVRGYGRHRTFLQNGGPDAAAFAGGHFYIFKECQYVSMRGTLWHLGEPGLVRDLGLPCNIDAAWADVDEKGMTILKGDQIWKLRNNVATGPFPFTKEFHIWSWQLKPFTDERFNI